MDRPASTSRAEEGSKWVWADLGPGPFCCQAQADGVPCFEVGVDCEECEEGREGWLRRQEEKHTAKARPRFP